MKPFITWHGENLKAFKNITNITACYSSNKKFWMTQALFHDALMNYIPEIEKY